MILLSIGDPVDLKAMDVAVVFLIMTLTFPVGP